MVPSSSNTPPGCWRGIEVDSPLVQRTVAKEPQHPTNINQDRPMNAHRLRLARRWSIRTMLIFVGWCSIVVWLNVRPHSNPLHVDPPPPTLLYYPWVEYGCPFVYARSTYIASDARNALFRPVYMSHFKLAVDVAIGGLLSAFAAWASSYVLRRITSKFASFGPKPSPPHS